MRLKGSSQRASIALRQYWTISLIALTINGENRSFQAPLNVAGLIERLQLQDKRVALERNGEIVPRSQFAEQELSDGDTLEIVVAVGGG